MLSPLTSEAAEKHKKGLFQPNQEEPVGAFKGLPFEILGEIFLRCIGDATHRTDFGKIQLPCMKQGQVSLIHVSSFWRAVALSTPQLWSFLIIDAARYANSLPRLVAIVTFWLTHSQNASIEFQLEAVGPVGPQSTIEILRLLIPHVHRCPSIRFILLPMLPFLNEWGWAMLFLSPLSSDIIPSKLEHIEVELGDYSHAASNLGHLAVFLRSTPCVKTLVWRNDPRPLLLSGWSFNHIRSLELGNVAELEFELNECDETDIVEILRHAPMLETLTANLRNRTATYVSTSPPITHQVLESLRITHDGEITALVQRLTLPRLRKLSLISGESGAPNWLHQERDIVDMLQRSSCTLNSLSMSLLVLPGSGHLLLSCRSPLESISHLDLTSWFVGCGLMPTFMEAMATGNFFPALTSLKMTVACHDPAEGSYNAQIFEKLLLAYASRVSNRVSRLETFYAHVFTGQENLDDELTLGRCILRAFKVLREAGVDVQYSFEEL